MHVLFVHRSFPARFGHLAQRLVDRHGCRVTFVSARGGPSRGGIRRVAYEPVGGETPGVEPLARPSVTRIAHAQGVFRALRHASAGDASIRPDLVIGVGGSGATTLLPELWPDVPVVSLFENFHRPPADPVAATRPPLPARLRARLMNADVLLDLETAAAGFCPTEHQRSLFPPRYRDLLSVVPDSVDTATWYPVEVGERRIGTSVLRDDDRLVTYLARPGEPAAGRAVAMEVARGLADADERTHVVVAAPGAEDQTPHPRIHGIRALPPARLRRVLAMSDAHLHVATGIGVPWSVLDAMACGVRLVATDTPALREVVTDGVDGFLVPSSTSAIIARVREVLERGRGTDDGTGAAARRTVLERYATDVVMPRLLEVLARAVDADPSVFEPGGQSIADAGSS